MEQPTAAPFSVSDTNPPPAGILANLFASEPDTDDDIGGDDDTGGPSSIEGSDPEAAQLTPPWSFLDSVVASSDVEGNGAAPPAPETEPELPTPSEGLQAEPEGTIGPEKDALPVASLDAGHTSALAVSKEESERTDEHPTPSQGQSSDVEPVDSLRGGFFWPDLPSEQIELYSRNTSKGGVREEAAPSPSLRLVRHRGFWICFRNCHERVLLSLSPLAAERNNRGPWTTTRTSPVATRADACSGMVAFRQKQGCTKRILM